MFRAQSNVFDDVVVKATDENLTSENWEYILDVCDKVGSSDTGAQQAVAAMIKRLAHRNANVQLYTLELANALSQNCGLKMHKELASRSFTDALLRLANDRNTHQQVKAKILERMQEWSDMFSRDPDLGIMQGAYNKLKSQNPSLRAPSKPQKTQISEAERQKEEEELQMALAMSIRESKGAAPATAKSNAPQDTASAPQSEPAQAQAQAPPPPQGTTAATVSRVRALFDFQPSEPGELQFKKGDIIAVLESVYKDWWKGSLRGQTGIFPLNYVEKLQDPTREELEREAQMEADVFAQIRNVEKLLALLSTSSQGGGDVRDNEEITELYHSTLAIRPKLIELIGKYSQKKDDFTQLNEKFIKGRRDYESLLEASMTQAAQPAYGAPRPAYGAYNAPPPSQYAGYPPSATPAQDPNRFYGAGAPPPSQGAYPPGSQGSTAPPYPPSNSAANPAFFMVPPGEQRQTPAPQQGPPSNAYSADPALNRVPVGRPQSFAPQELATGHYDSPVDSHRQSFHGSAPPNAVGGGQEYGYPPTQQGQQQQQQQQQQQTQPPGYPPQQSQPPPSAYEHVSSPPPQQQQQQQHDQQPPQSQYGYPPQQTPSQPGYAPPAPPAGAPSSPPPPQQQQQQQGGYLPYRPGGQAPVGGGADEGFYR